MPEPVTILIVKNILDVAKTLFGFRDNMAKAQKQKRDEMADYFSAVSICLAETYKSLTLNVVPHGRCAELYSYAKTLPEVVEGFVDKDKASELSDLLMSSYKVEGLWDLFNIDPEKKMELPKIEEASGVFLALSNSVRAGYKPN